MKFIVKSVHPFFILSLVMLVLLQGCGGSAMICKGVIANIPQEQFSNFDSLTVTLRTPQGAYSKNIPLEVQQETGMAPFAIGAGTVKTLFPDAGYREGDTLSIGLERRMNAIVRVSSYRDTEAGVLDSLLLSDFNFEIECDRLVQRFDTLGLVKELHFVKSFDRVRVAPYSVTLGSSTTRDQNLTLPVEVDHLDIDLPCGYDPFDKYKPD